MKRTTTTKHHNHHNHRAANHVARTGLLSQVSEMRHALNQLSHLSPFSFPLLERLEKEHPLHLHRWMPNIDMKEEASKYVIFADIPGVDAKNLEISLDNNMLVIRGNKSTYKKETKKNCIHTERCQGAFYRTIALPTAADPKKIAAKYCNGVLEVTVGKNKTR